MNIFAIKTKIYTNKKVLNALEHISDHGASFAAGTAFLMSAGIRPLAIWLTPDTENENKQYAVANSLGSSLIKLGIVEAVAIPVENAIKKIDKSPKNYLSLKTIQNLSPEGKSLSLSKSYKMITQVLKLASGLVMAIPKSILTVALIPVIMDKIFQTKNVQQQKTIKNNSQISFGSGYYENLAKGLGKIIDNKEIQDLAKKYQAHDKDIAKHMSAGTDILLTSASAYNIQKNDKIKENRKKTLIYNNIIATIVTLTAGYGIDKIIKNKSHNIIQEFKTLNAGNPKLMKYVEGINILRPTIIFAGVYYGILPMVSTYFSEKLDKILKK